MAKKCVKWGRTKTRKVCRKFSGGAATKKKGKKTRGKCIKFGKTTKGKGKGRRVCRKFAKRK